MAVIVRPFPGGWFAEVTYLVYDPAAPEAVLVDPGAATPDALRFAERQGLRIVAVLLTHAHLDHVEGVPAAKAATGAPLYLHPDDAPLYRAAPEQAAAFGLPAPAPLPEPEVALAHGQQLAFGPLRFEVRHVPGHAPGHVVFVADGFALVGDTVFRGSIGRTDLPGGDLPTLLAGIRAHLLSLPDGTTLHPGHGPETTVGWERRTNPFLVPHAGGSVFV